MRNNFVYEMKVSIICVICVAFILIQTVFAFNIDFKQFKTLLDEEKDVITSLKNYVTSQENKLRVFNHFVQNYEENDVPKDNSSILENPILTYSAIKRLTVHWNKTLRVLGPEMALIDYNFTQSLRNFSSDNFILHHAAYSVSRLANLYNLDIKLLAQGIIKYRANSGQIKTIHSNQTLDDFDCYLIARNSYLDNENLSAKLWLEEALKRIHTNDFDLKYRILGLFAKISYKLGETNKAVDYLQESLSLIANNEEDMDYATTLKNFLLNDYNNSEKFLQQLTSNETEAITKELEAIDQQLNALCRKKSLSDQMINSELKCYYLNTTRIPYLRLNRICVEELHKRPQILFLHKFVSEKEIESLKNLTQTKLKPLTWDEPNRVTQNYKFSDNESNEAATITRRIAAVTGLKMSLPNNDEIKKRNEKYLVHKYNTGGVYYEHTDGEDVTNLTTTNQTFDALATFIVYWNDVEAGGATYFSRLNLTVWPEKMGAILWFNYKRSGEKDLNMLHGSCPLLVGVKYISFRAITYMGQELNYPCSLNKDEYCSLH